MKTISNIIYAAFASVLLLTGALTANGATGDLFVSVNGTGSNGGGLIYQYQPTGVFRIFASGLSRPRGVAFSRAGNLFVTTTTFDSVAGTFQVSVVKITPRGVQSTVATLSGDLFGEGLTFDQAGNLFVMAINNTDPNAASTIYKFTPGGVQSTFGSVPGQGFGLAFDSAGNLYAADFLDITIYKFAPDGTRSVFVGPSAFPPDAAPLDFAFDRFGNLFASCGTVILEFAPDGTESTFATDVLIRGLAFDRRSNLFVAEVLNPGNILKFTPDGTETVFASGIPLPEFVTFQAPQGN